MGDAGQSLAAKPEGGNRTQVFEMPELACGEPLAEEGEVGHLTGKREYEGVKNTEMRLWVDLEMTTVGMERSLRQ
jgi:hypothetical protein